MMTYVDGTARELEDGEDDGADPAIYLGPDDLALSPRSATTSATVRRTNPHLAVAERIAQPGVTVARAAVISAPAVYLSTYGSTPTQRLLLAAAGAALGVAAADALQKWGWL